ncbi:hypothetical protein [Gilliamella sp. Pas-s95]|uniref:hypothetical protein n=1 Tax=Gilliamella sp. Pas-s95 TaxID=2687317 RepID=UPI001323D24B|nr:hypothetical protein [Gilliamella sp. Pas-s95]MWN04814.1 hypothetical protein [Gilliamella sp. Pas-s95]
MIILIYIAYYFLSLLPIIISYRFRKYTISDYQYNKQLNWKKRGALIFNYIALIFQVIVAGELKSKLESLDNSILGYEPILVSAYIFLIVYTLFPISWLESPKSHIKKEKI